VLCKQEQKKKKAQNKSEKVDGTCNVGSSESFQ